MFDWKPITEAPADDIQFALMAYYCDDAGQNLIEGRYMYCQGEWVNPETMVPGVPTHVQFWLPEEDILATVPRRPDQLRILSEKLVQSFLVVPNGLRPSVRRRLQTMPFVENVNREEVVVRVPVSIKVNEYAELRLYLGLIPAKMLCDELRKAISECDLAEANMQAQRAIWNASKDVEGQ